MICFYHSADLDGHCSGAIVKQKYSDCELCGINYRDEFPWEKAKGQEVYMVDFSLQPFSDMLRLKEEAAGFIWIDHHKSAIEEHQKTGVPLDGLREIGKGACELAWEFLHGVAVLTTQSVWLLGRYDVWDLDANQHVLAFQYGLRMEHTTPENSMELWGELLFKGMGSGMVDKFIAAGKTILKYQGSQNEKYAKASAFETALGGLPVIAINKGLANSQLFDSVLDPEKHAAMVAFCWRKGQWTVSMYTTREDIDVGAIAKGLGGGGHKQAAGFQCQSLPFEPWLERPTKPGVED